MINAILKKFKKPQVEASSDLTPRGVAKTISSNVADFNSTFQHIREEQLKSYNIR